MATKSEHAPPQMSPELLIPLLADSPDLTALDDPKLWLNIRQTADWHGMSQLVAFNVRSRAPKSEHGWCDHALATSWSQYNSAMRNLEMIVCALKAEGIRPVALKGPLAADRHYKPAFLRKPSGDLDFAIREDELERACAALVKLGYHIEGSIQAARAFSHHVVLWHPTTYRIELHFRLSHGPAGLSVDPFIERAATHVLQNGDEVLVLAEADELFHLALHLVCGRFWPFFHLYELRRIASRASCETLQAAAAQAAEHHFAGAFALITVAFQACWGESFLPPGTPMPRTWLHWRIDENLFRAFQAWANSKSKYRLHSRIYARWLDLQTTDRSTDALKEVAMLSRFALYQLDMNRPAILFR